jgi:hypothetical protein
MTKREPTERDGDQQHSNRPTIQGESEASGFVLDLLGLGGRKTGAGRLGAPRPLSRPALGNRCSQRGVGVSRFQNVNLDKALSYLAALEFYRAAELRRICGISDSIRHIATKR